MQGSERIKLSHLMLSDQLAWAQLNVGLCFHYYSFNLIDTCSRHVKQHVVNLKIGADLPVGGQTITRLIGQKNAIISTLPCYQS